MLPNHEINELFEKALNVKKSYIPGASKVKDSLKSMISNIDLLITNNGDLMSSAQKKDLLKHKDQLVENEKSLDKIINNLNSETLVDFIETINGRLNKKFKNSKLEIDIETSKPKASGFSFKESNFDIAAKFFERQAELQGLTDFKLKEDYRKVNNPITKSLSELNFTLHDYDAAIKNYFAGKGLKFNSKKSSKMEMGDVGFTYGIEEAIDSYAKRHGQTVALLGFYQQCDDLIKNYKEINPPIAHLIEKFKDNGNIFISNSDVTKNLTKLISNLENYHSNKSIQPLVGLISDPRMGFSVDTITALQDVRMSNPYKSVKGVIDTIETNYKNQRTPAYLNMNSNVLVDHVVAKIANSPSFPEQDALVNFLKSLSSINTQPKLKDAKESLNHFKSVLTSIDLGKNFLASPEKIAPNVLTDSPKEKLASSLERLQTYAQTDAENTQKLSKTFEIRYDKPGATRTPGFMLRETQNMTPQRNM